MWLTIKAGNEAGTVVEVTGDRFVIGRDDSCDLVLADERVSREHAFLRLLESGEAEVDDLESSNGTFVDGSRLTGPVRLRGGEQLRVGDTVLAYSLSKPGSAKVTLIDVPADVAPEPYEPAKPMGRSTMLRLVRDVVASESRGTRRGVRAAIALGGVAVTATLVVGVLFATGTVGGDGSGSGASVSALERGTVLISGLDADGNVAYIGSGTIIREDGLILTNAHIGAPSAPGLPVQYGVGTSTVAPAKLQVALFQDEAVPAKPTYLAKAVAYDGYLDVAVLKLATTLDGKPVSQLNLPTVPVGRSAELRHGEGVTIIGYPGAGGGFEGQINVSRGTVSGFQQDTHIATPRGWIKTDAAMLQGNSGGLAADSSGRLIGIPSRIQCGSSLFATCLPGLDEQGKIRPIDLASPVIRAAETGQRWATPYVVPGTGRERFRFKGWAAQTPDASCGYEPVRRYPAGSQSYTAVYDVRGLAAGEDLALLKTHASDATSTPQVQQELKRWPADFGSSHPCYWIEYPAFRGDGLYSAQVFAGPRLKPVSQEQRVRIG